MSGASAPVRPVIFICGNRSQWVGVKVAEHCFRVHAARPDAFDVRHLLVEDLPQLTRRAGQRYLRKGRVAVWNNEDLQSFSPLRFLPPQLMNHQGRALVVDPDVFAAADVTELLERDMQGKAVLCREVARSDGRPPFFASSVMLLDCAKLAHWDWERRLDELFARRWDYGQWVGLELEARETIGPLEEEWNSFDHLAATTKALHTTERSTQPWKTGLPIDFDTTWRVPPRRRVLGVIPRWWLHNARRLLSGARPVPEERYLRHPHPDVEPWFFARLADALEAGHLGEAELCAAIQERHVRPDAWQLVERYRGWTLAPA